jgi:hypothetical protein
LVDAALTGRIIGAHAVALQILEHVRDDRGGHRRLSHMTLL